MKSFSQPIIWVDFPGTAQPFFIDQKIPTLSQYDIKFDPIYFLIHVPAFIVSDSLVHVIPKNYIFKIFDQNK